MKRPTLAHSGGAVGVGIDVGSSNVKAVAVDASGTVLASRRRRLFTRDAPPVSEQDPEVLWEAVVDCLAGLAAGLGSATSNAPPEVAIGVASQYSSTVAVAADGTPAGPLLMWRDTRGTEACHALLATPGNFELWQERHGIPPIGGGLSLGHVLHLSAEDPHGDTRFVEVMDYITARLTGAVTATRHTMFTSQLCDNRAPEGGGYDPELIAAAGLDQRRLPPLVPEGQVVGTVVPVLADRLGMASGSRVVAGMNDTAAVALATGADDGATMGLAIGTTAVLVCRAPAKAEDLGHEILTMPGPDGGYLVMAENGLGGRVIEFVVEALDRPHPVAEGVAPASDERPPGRTASDRYAEADAALAATSPGAGGVLCLPWLSGSLAPRGSGTARGGFINCSLETTRADLLRAPFEGVAHNVAWLLGHVEAFTGRTVADVRLTGGGATVQRWPQVIADVLNRPVRVAGEPSLSVARAAGLRALQRTGTDCADPADEFDGTTALAPDPSTRHIYARHQRAFEASFEALEPVWQQLNG
ncbi:MAG: FGGY family carbohydrate kinase [Microthrixaceae bacterium]